MHKDKCIICQSSGIISKTYDNRFCKCNIKFHKNCFISHYNHQGNYKKCLTNSHHFTADNKVKIHEFINAELYWIYLIVLLICNSGLVGGSLALYFNINSFYYLSLVCITSVYSYYLCPLSTDYLFILRGVYPIKYLTVDNTKIFSCMGEYLGISKKGSVNFINYEIILGILFHMISLTIGSLYIGELSDNNSNNNGDNKYDQIILILCILFSSIIVCNKIHSFTSIPPTIVENFNLEVRR